MDGKRRHVGTKIRSKIEANFERPILQKVLKTDETSMILVVFGFEVGTKNRSKIEAQDGWPLGIDFSWILMGFGRQVGTQNRRKIDLKRHPKRDAKK